MLLKDRSLKDCQDMYESLRKELKADAETKVLVIQVFMGQALQHAGRQVLLLNEYDSELKANRQFYSE